MPVRSMLAMAAGVLAAMAAVVASLDGDPDIVPFFVGLTLAGGVGAWAVHDPYGGRRRLLGRGIGGLWLIAAGWIGVLLIMYQANCACSSAEPIGPEATYLGLTATVYHLAGVYLGGALMAVAPFSRALARA
jgi:hypothetical protein